MKQHMERVVLERLHYCISQHLDLAMLDKNSVDVDVHIDRIARNICLRLTLDIWSDKLQDDTQSVCYPRSWWNHFKRDAIPTFTRWFTLGIRFQMIKVRFKRTAIFPKLNQYSHGPTAEFVIHEQISFDTIRDYGGK